MSIFFLIAFGKPACHREVEARERAEEKRRRRRSIRRISRMRRIRKEDEDKAVKRKRLV
jgi:hypothetical protein